MAIGAAVFLGQVHRLVDADLVGHVEAVAEFIGADQEGCVLDRRKLLHRAVEMWLQCCIQGLHLLQHAFEQLPQKLGIRLCVFMGLLGKTEQAGHVCARRQALIQGS